MPGKLLAYFIVAWTFSLTGLVFYRLVTGQIRLDGLLLAGDGGFSPERAQLLLTSLAGIAVFANQALASGAMPDPSAFVVGGLAGSQALYVVGKYVRQLIPNVNQGGSE